MKLSISFSFSVSSSIFNYWDNSLAAVCLLPGTWQTVKLNSWIHAIHCVINAPDRSWTDWFSWVIRVLISSSKTNETEYKYSQHFFSIFSISWYSHFSASYHLSISDQILLLYWMKCCLFLFCFNCMRTPSHSSSLAFISHIISSVSSV